MEEKTFSYKGTKFTIKFIHKNLWRIIELDTFTWEIVIGNDVDSAVGNAKKLIAKVFANGKPNFRPLVGDQFVVTGEAYDYATGSINPVESIGFRSGTHSQNPTGTGNVYANHNEVITFDREGEDDGFWYLDHGKTVGDNYWKYNDNTPRECAKGSKPWALIWELKIKSI